MDTRKFIIKKMFFMLPWKGYPAKYGVGSRDLIVMVITQFLSISLLNMFFACFFFVDHYKYFFEQVFSKYFELFH